MIELDPNNVRAYLGHATTMIGQQKFDLALKDLDAADAIQPDVPMAQYLRGVMDFQNKQWDQAAERLQKVLTAVPIPPPEQTAPGYHPILEERLRDR